MPGVDKQRVLFDWQGEAGWASGMPLPGKKQRQLEPKGLILPLLVVGISDARARARGDGARSTPPGHRPS